MQPSWHVGNNNTLPPDVPTEARFDVMLVVKNLLSNLSAGCYTYKKFKVYYIHKIVVLYIFSFVGLWTISALKDWYVCGRMKHCVSSKIVLLKTPRGNGLMKILILSL